MMRARALRRTSLFAFASACAACQIVSGASSLDIVDVDSGAAVPVGDEDGTSPPGDANAPPDAERSDAEVDAPFVACMQPTGGSFTTCRIGGLPGVSTCVEYCATFRKCCAEDCQAYSTDPTKKYAEFVAASNSVCVEPLSGPVGSTYLSCQFAPLPGADMSFKCCCR